MDPRRIRAVALRIATQFRHDHRSLGLLIVAPVLVMSLVGALWGGSAAQTARVIVVGQAPPIQEALRHVEGLEVSTATRVHALERLRDGTADAMVEVRVGVVRTEFVVTVEGSDPQRTSTAMSALQRGLLSAASGAVGQPGVPAIQLEYLYGGPDRTVLDSLAPLLIGVFAFFFTFLLAAVSFLRERTSGTLERLMATPLTRGELVVGYLAGFSFFALIQAAVIIAFTILVLRVRFTGNVATIFLIAALLVIVSVSLGLFVSAFARNELQAIQFIPIVITPQVFLSGLLVPVDRLPEVLRPLSVIMPLTYSNEAMRAVMIRGVPLSDPLIVRDLLAIALFALVTIAGATLSIRREVA